MTTPLRIGVMGATGRVGRRICILISRRQSEMELVAAFSSEGSPYLGRTIGSIEPEVLQGTNVGSICVETIQSWVSRLPTERPDLDAIIDFSTVQGTMQLCSAADRLNCALIIGTTGFSVEHKTLIDQTASKVPILMAPNFSIMLNVLLELVSRAAASLPHADVEVVEVHHRNKRDAPSGTALSLASAICEPLGRSRECLKQGRHGMSEGRDPQEIGMHALRLGGVIGDHTVYFGTELERLELSHHAQSRDVFADGAIHASKWLVEHQSKRNSATDQGPRLYSMKDVVAATKI